MDDEFAKIDWLAKHLGRGRHDADRSDVPLGIGDDAAIVDFGGRSAVVTVDTQVEGVHFRRSMLTDAELGARAVITAASDVWAMGTAPTAAVVALTLPRSFSDPAFFALMEGVEQASRELGIEVAGGNLSAADVLTLTTTVMGPAPVRALTRAGARAGDSVYVTGTLGAAALGLRLLEHAPTAPGADAFISRWRRPPFHRDALPTLASVATAAIDVSDGLLQDLSHLCRASDVGAVVQADALPVDALYRETCEAVGVDALELCLAGGEDYEILFTAPEGSVPEAVGTVVGHVIDSANDVSVVDAGGAPVPMSGQGFRHFS